jgi:FdhE protein
MTVSSDRSAADLGRQYPEWLPWLTVIEQVLREATDTRWEAFVPGLPESQVSKVPLLAGATLNLEPAAVGAWSQRLLRAAYQSGAPKMATLDDAKQARLHAVDLFNSSLCQNWQYLREAAVDLGVEAEALQAVAALVPVPFLQACNRRWQRSVSESWTEGYCPVCGAWPAFAEVRGIERGRYLRCGRCGGNWQAQCLNCSYCGMTDHKELVSLVPEKSASNAVIEACKRCLGYVKTFTVLQGSPPIQVMVDDLASVDLDIAALELGYRRPADAGYALDVKVVNGPRLSETISSWIT